MKEVKSQPKRRPAELPPQQSATDTSNWENRNVSAPSLDKITNKRIVRDIEFIRPKEEKPQSLTLAQIQRLQAQDRAKKTSK